LGRIHVLGDSLINRIAAGEVVERPASVVKELVENSLDAGATAVDVRLQAGGRRQIRVTDDGCGMDRDDALLAIERHATSKLRGPEDLDSIATLGFRGEALASIAAVSQFTLSTARADGDGIEVRVRGGRIESVREMGLPRGTSIQVDRLFFNMPARRKFLRTESTELSHVARWVTRYALALPQVRFRLEQGERALIVAPPANDRYQRIASLFGEEFTGHLLPFEGRAREMRVEGLAGRPLDAPARRDRQHLFVNGRSVQDRVLGHAISQAYGNTMPKGRYPAMFLFVEIEPSAVDVNVHPQKTEVRFRDGAAVHDLVRESIAAALSDERVLPGYTDLRPESGVAVSEAAARFLERHQADPKAPDSRSRFRPGTPRPLAAKIDRGALPHEAPRPSTPTPDSASNSDEAEASDQDQARSGARSGDLLGAMAEAPELAEHRAVPLAQFRQSYIVAQDEQGLVVVDQHAAHERVIFERYLAEASENRVEIQRLMFPAIVELSPAERVLLEKEQEEFLRLGFLVEAFGGNSVRVEGVPALAADLDPGDVIRELLGEAGRTSAAAAGLRDLRYRLVTSAACQAAIKIHYPLGMPAMQTLLDDLYRTENPSTCPHGRPALFRLSLEEIERTFRRR